METRALVDWAAEPGLADPPVDDWTAGDDLDFTVAAPRRRRITDAASAHVTRDHEPARAPARRPGPDLALVPPVASSPDPAARSTPACAPAPAPTPAREPGRRTVSITGRPDALRDVPRLREIERRQRHTRSPAERVASRPDRIAMWAVALGFVLILIASVSG